MVKVFYPNVADRYFVIDPVDGGVGFENQPGGISARGRVFDNLNPVLADDGDTAYCHVSILAIEDLQKFQSDGLYCGMTSVGKYVATESIGLPFAKPGDPDKAMKLEHLKQYMSALEFRGSYESEKFISEPKPRCSTQLYQEDVGFSIAQMAGIWFLVFAFALMGTLVYLYETFSPRRYNEHGLRKKMAYGRDQFGKPIKDRDQVLGWMGKNTTRRPDGRRTYKQLSELK